ncbi:DUF1211 domain-containing protein [Sphingomonas antarctica]|uniref:TMEM175 family protein n=1 Tax=Sphingomonas antarctica TaxID=2040274 RepID=UPI0039EB8911
MRAGGVTTDHPLERLIFFSDAVFAIAITLLVIEIHVPDVADARAAGGYGNVLLETTPSFFAFLISFAVIARFWAGHHAAFSMRARFDKSLLIPNFILLLCIAFMPFSTAFLAKNLGQFVPALFYNVSLLALATASLWVVHLATRADDRLPNADPLDVRMLHARGIAVALGALIAIALTFVDPRFSQVGLVFAPMGRFFVRRPVAA